MAENTNTMEAEVNMQDLAEVLKAQGLDIRELAKQAKLLKTTPTSTPSNSSPTGKPKKEFKLVLADYPDFVIERTTATATKRVVIMPSCEGYYLKTIPNKNPENSTAETLTAELYTSFSQGMEEIEMPKDFWLKKVMSGKRFYDSMELYLKTEGMIDAIKVHCAPTMKYITSSAEVSAIQQGYKENIERFTTNRTLNIEFAQTNKQKAMHMLKLASNFIKDVSNRFGLNNARDFLNSFEDSLIPKNSVLCFVSSSYTRNGYVYKSRIPDCEMQYAAFKEYVLYDSIHMGYANNMSVFFQEWDDVLTMQKDIYGKIKEKYSKSLPTLHNQLAYKHALRREVIDVKKFTHAREVAATYEYANSKYCIISPKKRADFYDEAVQQANCVAGYINKFIELKSIVVFMRRTIDPESSLVTIEIRGEDIVQARQARNAAITSEQRTFIYEWAQKKGLHVCI